MRVFQEEVKKRLSSYMKEKGFRLHNKTYYYIHNDIAYCVTFDQPSVLMYTTVHVIPLYIPTEVKYYTYGNRLNHISDVKLHTLRADSAQTAITDWCKQFFNSMDHFIIPFFRQVDTPQKLLSYVVQAEEGKGTGYICCSRLDLERLRLYTYLYLRDFANAEIAANSYQDVATKCTYLIPSLREKLQNEAGEIKRLILKGSKIVDQYCQQTIDNTRNVIS